MDAVMRGAVQMREFKYAKAMILGKIKENREKHTQEYEEACKGYRSALLNKIVAAVTELDNHRLALLDEDRREIFCPEAIRFNIPVPVSHEEDYDQAIAMIELCLDEEITLRSDEFACYVLDKWDWVHEFKTVTSNYR